MSKHTEMAQGGGINMKCNDIQPLLFDYMSHELGNARSDLVREHLRKCADCRKCAAEMAETMDILKKSAVQSAGIPRKLSDDRRKRIRWTFTHPAMYWIEKNHVVVSILVAVLIIIILAAVMMQIVAVKGRENRVSFRVFVNRISGVQTGGTANAGAQETNSLESGIEGEKGDAAE